MYLKDNGMLTLKGNHIFLRALEPEDIEAIYHIENDETLWHLSDTLMPFSRFAIKQYLANAQQDIYEAKQLRLAICDLEKKKLIGLVDIFDFDAYNKRAGIGILITQDEDRNKGFGKESLELIVNYTRIHLQLHQLYANILEDNLYSIALFEKTGFSLIGMKKEWRRFREMKNNNSGSGASYKNELLYQLLL